MTNLLLSPSLYTLFLYTLIDDSWLKSDYVLSTRVPLPIHDRLRELGAQVYTVPVSNKNLLKRAILENFEYMKYYIKSRGKKYSKVYGNDEVHHCYKYREAGIELIEDGPFNSESMEFFKRRRWKQDCYMLNFWFYWLWRDYIPYGYDRKVKTVWHTESIKLNEKIEAKGKLIDLRMIWEGKSDIQKSNILSLFSMDLSFINELSSYNNVLVTQVLPIPDDEKISIYRSLVAGIAEEELLIKTHYAEGTDYKKYFPKAKVVSAPVPFQLFDLMGFCPKRLMTISSSAILPFVKEGVEVVFWGTEIDERIKKVYGVIRYSDIIKA